MAYASRSMSETERCYAQIEKEALSVTWSCEKFSDYILGNSFTIETDHKPFVPLLNPSVLIHFLLEFFGFQLRMDRFDYIITHVPEKFLYTADTLSRAPINDEENELHLQKLTDIYVQEIVIPSLLASSERLDIYHQAQKKDFECSSIIDYCKAGMSIKSNSCPAQAQTFLEGTTLSHSL